MTALSSSLSAQCSLGSQAPTQPPQAAGLRTALSLALLLSSPPHRLTLNTLCQALGAGRRHPRAWRLSPAALPKPGAATGRPPASQPRSWWGALYATLASLPHEGWLKACQARRCAGPQPFALGFVLYKQGQKRGSNCFSKSNSLILPSTQSPPPFSPAQDIPPPGNFRAV